MSRIILRIAICAALGVPVAAHGGMYRGPGGGTPGGPSTPGGPFVPGSPSTGGGIPSNNVAAWQFWWEHNKDPFLRLRERVLEAGARPADDGSTQAGPTLLVPTDADKKDVLLPALERLLEASANRDVQTAVMIALAKIGVNRPELDIQTVFRRNLGRSNQEVRETAALCLGIAGQVSALADLVELATDSRAARALVGRSSLTDRTRAMSIYGLGLLARRHAGDLRVTQQAYDVLSGILADVDMDNRDVQVATVHALGLLRFDTTVPAQKRLLWRTLAELDRFYARDLGKADQIVQAHVPIVIARLLGRGRSGDHQRYKASWVEELGARQTRKRDVVYQSLVLALGRMSMAAESEPDDESVSLALQKYYEDGKDQQARFFSIVALGQIGGEANRTWLLTRFPRARKGTAKPWFALALGLHARGQRDNGAPVDTMIGRQLHRGMMTVSNDDHRAACAVALGLTGYTDAVKDLRRLLQKHKKHDMVAGYLCLSLAMLDADEALDDIRKVVADSVRRPNLLTQGAISIALLGDKDAIDDLLRLLQSGDTNLAKLASVATAFRYVGDRRAIEPLVKLMFDRDMTTLSRAFVGAALGGIADKDMMPWNTPLSVGANYRAAVGTFSNGLSGVLDIL